MILSFTIRSSYVVKIIFLSNLQNISYLTSYIYILCQSKPKPISKKVIKYFLDKKINSWPTKIEIILLTTYFTDYFIKIVSEVDFMNKI